jgi:hypothetical protein
MAGGHGWSHPKNKLLAPVSRSATSCRNMAKGSATAGRTAGAHREASKISSGQRLDSIQQISLACDPGDLIAQLAVLEKE